MPFLPDLISSGQYLSLEACPPSQKRGCFYAGEHRNPTADEGRGARTGISTSQGSSIRKTRSPDLKQEPRCSFSTILFRNANKEQRTKPHSGPGSSGTPHFRQIAPPVDNIRQLRPVHRAQFFRFSGRWTGGFDGAIGKRKEWDLFSVPGISSGLPGPRA